VAAEAGLIEIEAVSKSFGGTAAVSDLTLTIADGAFCVLIGPSGCGKSTVLRMINAMIAPDAGTIRVRGQDIAAQNPEHLRRQIGYAIQSVGLFPHWTVAANIVAVPRLLRWAEPRIKARLDAVMALVGIDPALLPRYPHQLSGGQQQRIGVARALAADPDIVLMDEPFAALDPPSRLALRGELSRIHAETGKTIIFVTHDLDEALGLATQIALMRQGRLVQAGAPRDMVLAPADDFVRSFFGGPQIALRRLDLVAVAQVMKQVMKPGERADAPELAAQASLRTALDTMLAHRCTWLCVKDATGRVVGTIEIADILQAS